MVCFPKRLLFLSLCSVIAVAIAGQTLGDCQPGGNKDTYTEDGVKMTQCCPANKGCTNTQTNFMGGEMSCSCPGCNLPCLVIKGDNNNPDSSDKKPSPSPRSPARKCGNRYYANCKACKGNKSKGIPGA